MKSPLLTRISRTAGATAASIALAAALVAAVPSGRVAAQPATVSVSFDWTVPDRLGADGMIGVSLPITESAATMRVLNPEGTFGGGEAAGWPADFNACASQGFIVRYVWKVNGTLVSDSAACGPTRIVFPREGKYRVEITAVDTFGFSATSAQDVNIQDWLIIGLGDSYGSGEGNPNVPASLAGAAFDAANNLARVVQDVQAQVTATQASVDAAQQAVDEAIADVNAMQTTVGQFAATSQELLASQAVLAVATAELTASTAALSAAQAKVWFECAQWWDPAGCSAARSQLTLAHQRQGRALDTRATAATRRNNALNDAASKAASVGVATFEYALEVVTAGFNSRQETLELRRQNLSALTAQLQYAIMARDSHAGNLLAKTEGLATWQDTMVLGNGTRYSQCHQSKFAGQATAALTMEQDDPKTSVTFIHLACTGATIREGILGAYQGVTPAPAGIGPREPQIDVAKRISTGREVDALLTSIGGNDIGFAKIMEGCIVLEPCYAGNGTIVTDQMIKDTCFNVSSPGSLFDLSEASCILLMQSMRQNLPTGLPGWLNSNLAALPGLYGELKTATSTAWPGLPADRMFLTQYPIVTRNELNQLCGNSADSSRELPGISSNEYSWAETQAGQRLNQVIVGTGTSLGWTPVTGIDEAFRLHGYCSTATWIVRIKASFETQATYWGIAHPTKTGHEAYATHIAAALHNAFYQDGVTRVDGRQ